jgi:hypothetical protein
MIIIPSHAPDISEAVLQRLILGRLAVLERETKGACAFWRQVITLSQREGRTFRAGKTGQPDIGGVVLGRAWGIEVKRRRGRQRKSQIAYEQRFTGAGGRYYVVRTLAEALVPVCQALGLEFEVT